MAGPHRIALAGLAGPVRLLEDGGQSFLPLAPRGVYNRLLAEVHRHADAHGQLNWLVHYVDGSVVLAHQHAAGARHASGART